jgi:Na+/proline symporter
MGVVVGSAVPPIAFCITWNKISAAGAISGALAGLFGAIITWICTAKVGVIVVNYMYLVTVTAAVTLPFALLCFVGCDRAIDLSRFSENSS